MAEIFVSSHFVCELTSKPLAMDSFEVVPNSDEYLDGLSAALDAPFFLFGKRSETPSESTSSLNDKVGCNESISYWKLFTLNLRYRPSSRAKFFKLQQDKSCSIKSMDDTVVEHNVSVDVRLLACHVKVLRWLNVQPSSIEIQRIGEIQIMHVHAPGLDLQLLSAFES
jgi:hypothetical protein